MARSNTLYRYTNLASAIHLLRRKEVTLLNPAGWDDKNDAYFMAQYKKSTFKKSLLALCFSLRSETYHHWRIFSPGADGVRIEFFKDRLLESFEFEGDLTYGSVKYLTLKELQNKSSLRVEELPYIKRASFEDEAEFRVVYSSSDRSFERKAYAIDLASIRRITISPWTPPSLADEVMDLLLTIDGCRNLKVYHSSLLDNEDWRELASNAF